MSERTHTVETTGGLSIDHPAQNQVFVETVETPSERAPLDTMPHGSFQSSNVHSALYDFGERRLYVRYLRDGPDAIYQYWGVPAQVWQGLVDAGSKGSFINEFVAYEYRYALAGRDDFPTQNAIGNDLLRRFVFTG